MDLDFMPSPAPDRPGLLIRDPYHYSDATLIIPPELVGCLQFFDGERTDLDLRAALVELTGDLRVGDLEQHLVSTLSQAGFFEDEVYQRMKDARHAEFAEAPRRAPAHAGAGYPDQPEELRSALAGWMDGGAPATAGDSLVGIAAPHVSPEGGLDSYRAAYAALGPRYQDRVFVILGTSHYGEPERFGLTRKPFATPYGEAVTDIALVDRLASESGSAVKMEDYCHAVEHSIEFQVVFLQHLYGAGIRILPILCGPFARSIQGGGPPEEDENVRRFLGALGELAAHEGERLFWVLGVDMAHMGRRYGDPFAARAGEGQMSSVTRFDHGRIERIGAADAAGFWESVQENRDALKWCGSAPFYTFLRAVPQSQGELLHYQQWNIDEQSVVSFGAMAFRKNP
jgi:AmmeMemoRadiSam system protein B